MKSMLGYTRHQPYGLSQAIPTPHFGLLQAMIQNPYTGLRLRTMAWPARSAQGGKHKPHPHTALLALIKFTTQGETHTQGTRLQKKVLALIV